jgi:V8-like Glu-specific endopeptidase
LKQLTAALAAVFATMTLVGGASAITYGRFDDGGHPNTGAMVYQLSDGTYYQICSGSLIAPSVFLTASHCTTYLEGKGISKVWVTFDPTFDETSKLIPGTMHSNPAYNQSQSDPGDIAVITLKQPVRNVTPAQLPTLGLLDRMKKAGTLNGTFFTSVGYGVQQPHHAPGGLQYPYTSQRWVASGEFNSLNDAWLRISQNGATGDGGTCYGDSGGPQFLGAGATETNTEVSITITGDAVCKATNVDYRLDTPQARAFLATYVNLP